MGHGPLMKLEFAVAKESHLDCLVHTLRHNAATQACDAADLGAGGRFAGSYEVDDAQQACHFVCLCAEPER